jgi:hypothetical protein
MLEQKIIQIEFHSSITTKIQNNNTLQLQFISHMATYTMAIDLNILLRVVSRLSLMLPSTCIDLGVEILEPVTVSLPYQQFRELFPVITMTQ